MFSPALHARSLPLASAVRGAALPADRAARMAARRAFVELKLSFGAALADIGGANAEWLRRQVRSSEEPAALWLLRGAVFETLAELGSLERRRRHVALRRALETLFPDSDLPSGFAAF